MTVLAVAGSISWSAFVRPDFEFTSSGSGAVVVDIGCGEGEQLAALQARGCSGIGVDVDPGATAACRAGGFQAVVARAEQLPLRAQIADGVICKVSLPYTDESAAITECARLLRAGGVMTACYHGIGYYVRMLLCESTAKLRFYGLRAMANTWYYQLTGKRFRGWVGDTIYQSRRRLNRYYATAGLALDEELAGPRFLGLPVFVYHRLRKLDSR